MQASSLAAAAAEADFRVGHARTGLLTLFSALLCFSGTKGRLYEDSRIITNLVARTQTRDQLAGQDEKELLRRSRRADADAAATTAGIRGEQQQRRICCGHTNEVNLHPVRSPATLARSSPLSRRLIASFGTRFCSISVCSRSQTILLAFIRFTTVARCRIRMYRKRGIQNMMGAKNTVRTSKQRELIPSVCDHPSHR